MCYYAVAYECRPEAAPAELEALSARFQSSCLHLYPGLCIVASSSARYVKDAVLEAIGRRRVLVSKVASDHDYELPPQAGFPGDRDLELLLPPRAGRIS